jgi:hypothetical protein
VPGRSRPGGSSSPSLGESRAQLFRAADAERRGSSAIFTTGPNSACSHSPSIFGSQRSAGQAPEQAAGLIQDAEAELQVATDELRELSQGIHPAILTDLDSQMRFEAPRPFSCRSSCSSRRRRVSPAEATAYFVFMEAGRTRRSTQALRRSECASSSPRELRIEVADDGRWRSRAAAVSGLRQRARTWAARSASSTLARGTVIVAAIPLDSMENS